MQACGPTIESSTRTTYWRGIYDTDLDLRAGFFRLSCRPGCPDGGKEHQPARRRLPSPLTVLHERAGLPAWPLPRVLADATAGISVSAAVRSRQLRRLAGRVTALGPEYPSSGSAISGHNPADRFVMGLLRACADVVLIGAGTLRATPSHRWTPAHVCPAAADAYAAFRRDLGRDGDPLLAVVTARGDLPE